LINTQVDHFSRYGLPLDSDDEAEGDAQEELMQLEPSGSGGSD
jgi:hypothetical protein